MTMSINSNNEGCILMKEKVRLGKGYLSSLDHKLDHRINWWDSDGGTLSNSTTTDFYNSTMTSLRTQVVYR